MVIPLNTTLEKIQLCKCLAQVKCGSTLYGWEAFDFNCKSDFLICNGTNVTDPNGLLVSPDCNINSIPCTTYSRNSSDICHNITKVCPNSLTDQFCPQNVNDHRITCSDQQQMNKCVPYEVVCGGQVYSANAIPNGIFCEGIKSVSCMNGIIEINQNLSKLCTILELYCDNSTFQLFTTGQAIPNNCYISKAACLNFPNIANCEIHRFGCIEDSECRYVDIALPCGQTCLQFGDVPACDCPVDYFGSQCELIRPLNCNLTLIYPPKKLY